MTVLASSASRRWRDWLPVASLGLAAFTFVTTELLPVGLLPDIAAGLKKPESQTGLLLTGYAWMVALTSLPLTAFSVRFDRRKLLLVLIAIFCAAHILAALAWDFPVLMAARICIALTHALFWSIVTPLAARVAPEGKKSQALAFIISGVSLATVLGMPLGTMLGHRLGWRMAFAFVSGIAFCVMLVLARLLPPLPSQNAGSLSSLPALLRYKPLLRMYVLTLIAVTGHFAAFTYLTPFFAYSGGIGADRVVLLLLLMGGSGLISSVWGGPWVDRAPRAALLVPLFLLPGCLALLLPASSGFTGAMAICCVWGAAFTALCLTLQTRVLQLTPDTADIAISLYSAIFNIGIGGGAFIGSRVFAHMGIERVGLAGGIFFAAALLVAVLSGRAVARSELSKPI